VGPAERLGGVVGTHERGVVGRDPDRQRALLAADRRPARRRRGGRRAPGRPGCAAGGGPASASRSHSAAVASGNRRRRNARARAPSGKVSRRTPARRRCPPLPATCGRAGSGAAWPVATRGRSPSRVEIEHRRLPCRLRTPSLTRVGGVPAGSRI
jgi:hypothetical protein